jgi:hypothetical protein
VIVGEVAGLRGAGRILRVAAVACCAAAGVAGCASGAASSQPPASTDRPPVPAVSSAPAGDPRVLARQAYLGMWQAFVAASRTADYQYPSLDHYAAGAALTLLIRGLYQNNRDGIITRASRPSIPPWRWRGRRRGRPRPRSPTAWMILAPVLTTPR